MPIDRRHVLTGFLAGSALTGCSIADRYGKRLRQFTDVGKFYLRNGGKPNSDDRAFVESVPFASIKLNIRGIANGLMTLSQPNPPNLSWESSDGFSVSTRNGRLVKTVGFESNLSRTDIITVDPLETGVLLNRESTTATRKCDFDGLGFDIVLRSEFKTIKEETITILGVDYRTLRVREKGRASGLNWRFSNEFWLDINSGFVWKSKQHGHPLMRRKFTIVTMRPYSHDPGWLRHLSISTEPAQSIET